MGKGSRRRPPSVPDRQLDRNWKLAFGRKKRKRPSLVKIADPQRPAAVHQF